MMLPAAPTFTAPRASKPMLVTALATASLEPATLLASALAVVLAAAVMLPPAPMLTSPL